MTEIKFHKLVASGNDFIVVDNRKKAIKNPKAFAAEVCPTHFGVGADGVLFIEPSRKADFFIRIVNSDGSEAEACGNGFRCVGLYATQMLKMPKKMKAETLSGVIGIEVFAKTVKVKMVNPSEYKEKVRIQDLALESGNYTSIGSSFINTGVPHTVIFTEGLQGVPVRELGRAIRYHKLFQPRGTNVNFAEVTGENALEIRTYERGVEDETLACGTGSVASAVVAALTDRIQKSPVSVKTKSGETLKIHFERNNQTIKNVFLEGSAKFVFEGRLLA